jgi:hypothetical protein
MTEVYPDASRVAILSACVARSARIDHPHAVRGYGLVEDRRYQLLIQEYVDDLLPSRRGGRLIVLQAEDDALAHGRIGLHASGGRAVFHQVLAGRAGSGQ